MIESIKNLYNQLDNKTGFMQELALLLGKKPNTLKNHWFSSFFSIPDEYQKQTFDFLTKTIESQKQIETIK